MYKIILIIIFSFLLHAAYCQCNSQAIDSDQDGVCDLLDQDDDNDGIIDAEETFCSSVDLTDLNFDGVAIEALFSTEIHLANNNFWRTSYSTETFNLPIQLEFKANTNNYSMIGLLPVGATTNATGWNDGAYKAYIVQNGYLYGKF